MLKIAALLNFIISLGHLVSLFFAEGAFKYVGIEKKMNDLSAIHSALPSIMTIGVAIAFFVFGLYALSADGVIRKLPLLKVGVYVIAISCELLSIIITFAGRNNIYGITMTKERL